MITFVKIVVIQPSSCKGNFNKTIYLSTYLSIYLSGFSMEIFRVKGELSKKSVKVFLIQTS